LDTTGPFILSVRQQAPSVTHMRIPSLAAARADVRVDGRTHPALQRPWPARDRAASRAG